MCVAVLGLGAKRWTVSWIFGCNLATGLAQRSAAQAATEQTYQSALISNKSAEQSFANQQEAAGVRETRASKAQEKLAKTIQGLQAKGQKSK